MQAGGLPLFNWQPPLAVIQFPWSGALARVVMLPNSSSTSEVEIQMPVGAGSWGDLTSQM